MKARDQRCARRTSNVGEMTTGSQETTTPPGCKSNRLLCVAFCKASGACNQTRRSQRRCGKVGTPVSKKRVCSTEFRVRRQHPVHDGRTHKFSLNKRRSGGQSESRLGNVGNHPQYRRMLHCINVIGRADPTRS
jgi:hypothetical protein